MAGKKFGKRCPGRLHQTPNPLQLTSFDEEEQRVYFGLLLVDDVI